MSAGLGAPGRRVGGMCVNRGCLPSKNLIEAARTYWESRNPRYPGRGAVDMPLDFGALVAQKDAVIGDYRGRKYASIVGGACSRSHDRRTIALRCRSTGAPAQVASVILTAEVTGNGTEVRDLRSRRQDAAGAHRPRLLVADQLRERGHAVEVVFDGAGTQGLASLLEPGHK